eukprot:6213075-Pleurochrysis_carterae.AAC.4
MKEKTLIYGLGLHVMVSGCILFDDNVLATAQLKGQRTARERAEQQLRGEEEERHAQHSEMGSLRAEHKAMIVQLASNHAEVKALGKGQKKLAGRIYYFREAARVHMNAPEVYTRDLAFSPQVLQSMRGESSISHSLT